MEPSSQNRHLRALKATDEATATPSASTERSLRAWLLDEDGLRGHLALVDRQPSPGELGSALDVLVATLAPGGVATGLAAGLMYWIRHRTSDIALKITKPDRTSIEISAKRVRQLDSDSLRTEIEHLRRSLES